MKSVGEDVPKKPEGEKGARVWYDGIFKLKRDRGSRELILPERIYIFKGNDWLDFCLQSPISQIVASPLELLSSDCVDEACYA